MAVFRIERTRDYTVMSNHHLRNHELSLKAKGLLSMMLSLPDDWNYTNFVSLSLTSHPLIRKNEPFYLIGKRLTSNTFCFNDIPCVADLPFNGTLSCSICSNIFT